MKKFLVIYLFPILGFVFGFVQGDLFGLLFFLWLGFCCSAWLNSFFLRPDQTGRPYKPVKVLFCAILGGVLLNFFMPMLFSVGVDVRPDWCSTHFYLSWSSSIVHSLRDIVPAIEYLNHPIPAVNFSCKSEMVLLELFTIFGVIALANRYLSIIPVREFRFMNSSSYGLPEFLMMPVLIIVGVLAIGCILWIWFRGGWSLSTHRNIYLSWGSVFSCISMSGTGIPYWLKYWRLRRDNLI